MRPEEAHQVAAFLAFLVSDRELDLPKPALRYYRHMWRADAIRERAVNRRQVLLTAKIDGKLVGILFGTTPEGGVATIVWVLIATTWRRCGIGAQLFKKACDRYRRMGCHKVKLTAPTFQTVTFYERQGMKMEGYHPCHWWRKGFWSMGKVL